MISLGYLCSMQGRVRSCGLSLLLEARIGRAVVFNEIPISRVALIVFSERWLKGVASISLLLPYEGEGQRRIEEGSFRPSFIRRVLITVDD